MFDDLDIYLADFGVPCMVGTNEFLGIPNQPDDVMLLEMGRAQSNMRELTVKTSVVAALGLVEKTAITIEGKSFEVRSLYEPDDGAFTTLRVRKL